ncbi:tRNA (guanine-N(1)-)-methyltransferase [endosymbiont of Euscepes postfasciatus]|nr:tRNA (guanine-N(1)-)-methyltransferase [endosymbiont of Euscepes postfasciatus]
MKIIIITMFPKIFKNIFNYGLIKKAIVNNIIKLIILDLKKFVSLGEKIDNYSYGGGGMVISCNPLYKSILKAKENNKKSKIIYLSPQGKKLNQNYINNLSKFKSIIIICGRYEGIDERIKSKIDYEISIGDYILSGGEIPAIVLIDSISRLIPGVIKNKISINNESFYNNLLDFPHYTRPYIFLNMKVPSILLSGNHFEIYKWRLKQSLINTWINRPDLINKINLKKLKKIFLNNFKNFINK